MLFLNFGLQELETEIRNRYADLQSRISQLEQQGLSLLSQEPQTEENTAKFAEVQSQLCDLDSQLIVLGKNSPQLSVHST